MNKYFSRWSFPVTTRGRIGVGITLLLGAAFVTLLAIAAHTLLRNPCLGVADILDFWRVMRPAGIEHTTPIENPGYYVRCEFRTTETDLFSAPSSSAILAWAAKHSPWGLAPGANSMDVRQLGLLYLTVLTTLLLVGLVRGLPLLTGVLFLYVVVDPGYLLFFNSFYADATLIVALVGICIVLASDRSASVSVWQKPPATWCWWAALLIFLALMGGSSKMQYALLPSILLLTLSGTLLNRLRDQPRRVLALAGALTVVSSLTPWLFIAGPGPRFLAHNNYHAVYGGILRVASNPEDVLMDLDIPEAYWDLPRTHWWKAGMKLDHPVNSHLESLSRMTLLRHYASDPAAQRQVRQQTAEKLTLVVAHPRGNKVRSPTDRRPVKRLHQVAWQFSSLTRHPIGTRPFLVWVLMAASLLWLVLISTFRSWDGSSTAMLFLLLWIASQILIAVLGEGLINLHQHLLGARLGLDLLLVLFLADLAIRIKRRLKPHTGRRI